MIGLRNEGMQSHRIVPGNKGDLWGKSALQEEVPALLERLWSKPVLVESGQRKRSRETCKKKKKYLYNKVVRNKKIILLYIYYIFHC